MKEGIPMNEENVKPQDAEKNHSALRYLAILFAVAFVLVLFSLLAQFRNSSAAIHELTQSGISALQNAEILQQNNRALQEELDKTRQAYELLLTAEQASRYKLKEALEPLEDLTQYLDREGLDVYESLMEKVEKNND